MILYQQEAVLLVMEFIKILSEYELRLRNQKRR